MSYAEKETIIQEVETIAEMLTEATDRLAELPRTATAARQLSVIVNRLEGWKRTYGPTKHLPIPKGERFSHQDVDRALKAYRKYGYFGLSEEQKEAVRWFDEHYRQG
jgi:5-bromo-4-chloroindolyl phosphate hydrolysis protein